MPKSNINLSVIVPCYNEKENIPLIVERFKQVMPKYAKVELVLVNNGSLDGSKEVMEKLAKKYKFLRMANVKKNIGYGYGVWSGLQAAKGNYLCWTHADMQTDLGDCIKAYNLIMKEKNPRICFVKGKRQGRNLFDSFFTFGMSVFETVVLRKLLYDINAQPNLFHRDFLGNTKEPPYDFSFDLYFYYMAKKNRYEIIRFPVLFRKRIHGQSSWNTSIATKLKFIKRTIDFTIKLRNHIKK